MYFIIIKKVFPEIKILYMYLLYDIKKDDLNYIKLTLYFAELYVGMYIMYPNSVICINFNH